MPPDPPLVLHAYGIHTHLTPHVTPLLMTNPGYGPEKATFCTTLFKQLCVQRSVCMIVFVLFVFLVFSLLTNVFKQTASCNWRTERVKRYKTVNTSAVWKVLEIVETCILLGELSETKLEFLWHTAFWASEDCVRGISDGVVRRGSAPLDAHDSVQIWGWWKTACIQ